jgi:hypothetical protein
MRDKWFIGILSAALVLRVWLAYASPGASYDIESYRIQANAVWAGQNIYEATFRHPYPPLWMYWPAAALKLSEATALPFYFWVKVPAIVADLGIGWLLFAWPAVDLAQRRRRAAWYLFNPIVLIVSAMHGQFDSIAIALVVLAARWQVDRKLIRSALSLSVAVALKGFPVLLLPVFLIGLTSWGQAIMFAALTASVIVVISVPYLAVSGRRLFGIMLNYNSTSDHSYGYVLRELRINDVAVAEPVWKFLRANARWLQGLATLGAAALSLWRTWPLEHRVAAMFAVTYVVSPGLASQQMLWILPFLILTRHWRALLVYTLMSTVALVLFYGRYFPEVLFMPAAWLGATIDLGRLIASGLWWSTVVGVLGVLLMNRSTVLRDTPDIAQ